MATPPDATADWDPFTPVPDPFTPQAHLRRACPVHRLDGGTVAVTGMQAVLDVLRRPEHFTSRPPRARPEGSLSIIHTDGDEHDRLRRLVNKVFTPRAVAAYEASIREVAEDLVDRFAGRGAGDLVTDFNAPFPAIVFLTILGVPPEDRVRFLEWGDEAISHAYASEPAPSDSAFREYVLARIVERRARATDDFISRLVHAEDRSQHLTDAELVAMVRILIIAGTETTANLLGTLFHQLLAVRERWEAVAADRSLVGAAVEEALRFDPPLNWVPRTTVAGGTVGEFEIPTGSVVITGLGSANRDDTVFEGPDSFRLDRGDTAPHVAFGHGSHYCVGAALARLEAATALRVLLDRLPDLRLADGFEFAPRGPVMMRGCASLPVRFTPAATAATA